MINNDQIQVVCGIVLHDGHILATRRDCSGRFPLVWEFPGGKLEIRESAEAALHRELEEELKLGIRDLVPVEAVDYEEEAFSIRLIPFLCRPNQAVGPVPHDHGEIRWITASNALQLTWAPADIPLVNILPNLIDTYENE